MSRFHIVRTAAIISRTTITVVCFRGLSMGSPFHGNNYITLFATLLVAAFLRNHLDIIKVNIQMIIRVLPN